MEQGNLQSNSMDGDWRNRGEGWGGVYGLLVMGAVVSAGPAEAGTPTGAMERGWGW